MVDSNLMKKVTNRSASVVVYRIPELNNLRREFQPGETKMIAYNELMSLSYVPGGMALLQNFLQVEPAVAQQLNLHTEPEYNMTPAQVAELLKNGSYDALLDCLDFAPDGVIELVKNYSVSLPLNDMQKRQAILDKTGFDVTKAIKMKEAEAADLAQAGVTANSKTNTTRRTSGDQYTATESKYKVVTPENKD